jgi:hypothetical protein
LGRDELLVGSVTLRITGVHVIARIVGEEAAPVARATILRPPPWAPHPPSFDYLAATDEDGRFDEIVQRLVGEASWSGRRGMPPSCGGRRWRLATAVALVPRRR